MQPEQGISRELSFGEIFSKTFDVYRRYFAKYFVLFAIVGVIIQIVTTLATQAFPRPAPLPLNPTPQQFSNYLSALFESVFLLVAVIFLVNVIFSTIAQGGAIKMASEEITKGQVNIGASVRFAVSKLLSMWALSILVGIIVLLGLVALIVPGIILAIMYSLALPVLLIENEGVTGSMGRSRQLVSHRWAKTFGTFLALGIIVLVASLIFSAITGPLGIIGPVVNGILSALYQPLFPILLAVYYYSNLARTAAPPPGQMPMAPTTTFQAGMKLCPTCGTQNLSSATFCVKCGARLN